MVMDADDLPRMRSDAAAQLAGESLDSYSQEELMERIALLDAEISRVKARHRQAADHRNFADQFFKPKDSQ